MKYFKNEIDCVLSDTEKWKVPSSRMVQFNYTIPKCGSKVSFCNERGFQWLVARNSTSRFVLNHRCAVYLKTMPLSNVIEITALRTSEI